MAEKTQRLEVVTPAKKLFSEDVRFVVVDVYKRQIVSYIIKNPMEL